jgi:predicted dehydrogenase
METTPATAIRVGIAGYGLAGSVFHAPLAGAVEGLEVHAILARSPERAAHATAAHPGLRVAGQLDELLEDIDVLVVATPNRFHADVALAGIERGLAVVVDKPLAPSAADARRLLEAGGRLSVFQNRRWDGDFLTVRRLLREGSLGDVVRFESRFERFRPEVDASRWRERADPSEGGGLVLDLGTHLVDQAVQLFGRPDAVYAEVRRRRPGAAVDDDAFIALEHAGGVRAHLWMSMLAPCPGPRLRVNGLAAGFVSEGVDPQEEQLAAGLRPRDPEFGLAPPGLLGDRPVELERGRWIAFYEGVRDWVRGEAPPPVDPADAVLVLEVLEAAVRSSERREVVTLGPGTPTRAPGP